MALTVDDQDSTSITSTIGLSVALPISTGFGVVSPYLRGEYLHEYQDQGTEITGNLRVNPLESFRLRPNSIDRNYFGAGGGMTLALGEGISAFVDYHIVLGYQDLVAQQATLGGRLEF
jgi:outer membrane autotransporter protein